MIERVCHPCGVVHYESTLLRRTGVPHAFSTRIGGVSGGVFDSLNLGNPSGCAEQDAEERIQENYRRLQGAAGFGDRQRGWIHQVHGNRVARVDRDFVSGEKADAVVSEREERVLAVRVADCVPVLIAREDGKRVAAVHAGWRGVIAGVVPATLAAMGEGDFVAAIGPAIGYDAFEVGGEVAAEFWRVFGEDAPVRPAAAGRSSEKFHVDLRQAIRRQLVAGGLGAGSIDVSDRCTVRDRGEFFSHRRDAGVTGRMAALIAAGARA